MAAALSFAADSARNATTMGAMHTGTPDYTRVDSLLNPLSPPAGPLAQELAPLLTLPTSPTPAATSVALGNPATEVVTIEHHDQSVQDELQVSLASPVSTPPSTGDAASAEGVTANGTVENAAVCLKTEDSGVVIGSPDAEIEEDEADQDTITANVPTFRCMNDEYEECHTGQITMQLSRKVISDHFGRNKACTRLITDWPLFCRKHYQRATYNQKLWQARKINLILRQFDIIQAQFPGTKYTVALKKSEEERLNVYSRALATHVEPDEAASFVVPGEGKHFEAPVTVLYELAKRRYLGPNKSQLEVEMTVHLIRDMLENEDTNQVPSIEFLPQLDSSGRPYDHGTNRRKTRISAKGGITKPSASKPAKKAKSAGRKAVDKPVGKGTAKTA